MRHHDLRMALAAMVAFGPVMFAAAYGIANAGKLQAANASIVAPAPVRPAALQPAPDEPRTMIVLPQGKHQRLPAASGAPLASDVVVQASLDRPRATQAAQ